MQAEQTCRVCLSGSDELTPLRLRLPGKTKTFEETINFVVNIHILLEHGLPDKICKDCGAMLDVADTFKQKVLESEAILNQLDTGKGTDVNQPSFEENDRVIVTSCSSSSDSLVAKVQNQDGYSNQKIKVEIVEEEYLDDEITGTEEAILPDNLELEGPRADIKEEFDIKEEILEIPLINARNEMFLLKPMEHMQPLHYSCKECGKNFPSRQKLESHQKDKRCTKHLIADDEVKPSTSGLTLALEDQEATYLTEGSNTKTAVIGVKVKRRGRPPKLGKKLQDTKSGSKNKKNTSKQKAQTGSRFICNECGRPYLRKEHLEAHVKTHTGEKPHPCNVCGKRFKRRLQLKIHSRTHTGDRPYSCNFCEKTFVQKAHLDGHKKACHLDYKPFTCDICEKSFVRKSHLNDHYVTHTGEKPYSCNVCEKKYCHKVSLDIHMRLHTGEKPFSCNICFKCFADKNSLYKHERSHTGERPFSCNICEKRFHQKPHLDSHLKTHTGERPYSCDLCGKKFSERSGLLKHGRTHTGEKPYSCDVCLRMYRDAFGLRHHSCKMKKSVNI